jgi:hypothetical protein
MVERVPRTAGANCLSALVHLQTNGQFGPGGWHKLPPYARLESRLKDD